MITMITIAVMNNNSILALLAIRYRGRGEAYGRFSKVRVCVFLPDPGALNSCMHTFPEHYDGFTIV